MKAFLKTYRFIGAFVTDDSACFDFSLGKIDLDTKIIG